MEKTAWRTGKPLPDLKYLKTDEWIKIEGDTATIGISDYAQDQMNDITYVELPPVGDELSKGRPLRLVRVRQSRVRRLHAGFRHRHRSQQSARRQFRTAQHRSLWQGLDGQGQSHGDADNPALLSAEQYAEWCNTR